MDADAVFEMDADFSHDPVDIPRLLADLEYDAAFVIGSRYVLGGGIRLRSPRRPLSATQHTGWSPQLPCPQ
jgi:dolichol-phosphate mannosyltransferase